MNSDRLDDQLRALWQANLEPPANAVRRKRLPTGPALAVVVAALAVFGAVAFTQSGDEDSVITGDSERTPVSDPSTSLSDDPEKPPTFESAVPVLAGTLPLTMVDGTSALVEVNIDGEYAEARVSITLVDRRQSLRTALYGGSARTLAIAHCNEQQRAPSADGACVAESHPVSGSNLSLWSATSDGLRVNAVGFANDTDPVAWLVPPADPDEVATWLADSRASIAHEAWLVLSGAPQWVERTAVQYHFTLVDQSGATGPALSVSPGCSTTGTSARSESADPGDEADWSEHVCVPSIVGVDTPGDDFTVSGAGRDLVDVIVIQEPSS